MKSSIGSCWLEPPSIKRRGKHVCGRRHSRWRSGERKRVAAGERIARIFRGGKSSLPRLGKRKLGGWWFLLSSAFEWNVTSAYLGFHWWEGLHRVLIIRCAEEKRDIYTHRRDVDPINFHLNRACLKNSSLRILVERQTFCLEDDHPFEHRYPSVSTLRERAETRRRSCVERKFEKYPEGGVKGSVQSRDSGQERKNARTPRVKVLGGYRSRCI